MRRRTLAALLLAVMASGAVEGSGPSLIDSLPPGQWAEVPDSKIRSVLPSPVPPGSSGPGAIIAAWNSGAYDHKRGRYLVLGGGHNDYGGNEIYAFDLRTLKWSRLWGPSRDIPPPQGPCQLAYRDGNPVSRHTYDGLEYLASVDRLWLIGGSLYCSTGGAGSDTWLFDPEARTWNRRSDFPDRGRLEMVSAYDPVSGHVFINGMESWFGLWEYDPVADRWIRRGQHPAGGSGGMTAAIDPKRRKFIAMGRGTLKIFDLVTGALQPLAMSGATGIVASNAPGLEYDPVGDRVVAWAGGSTVYALDLDTGIWTKDVGGGVVPTNQPPAGTYNRFRYIPSRDVFVVVNSIDENVFVYRPARVVKDAASESEPRAAPGRAIALPLRTFVALDPPRFGGPAAGSKHVTWAHNPLDGRLYAVGGDYAIVGMDAPDSYRQEVWSLDLGERWTRRADPDAGWRLEYPYCGVPGGVQPKSPDFVGWTWDATRNLFWFLPGTVVAPVRAVCPDRTVSTADDPKYKFNHLMTFDPAAADQAQRWRDIGPNLGARRGETWQAVYDPSTDTLLRFGHDGGRGSIVDFYDIRRQSWSTVGLTGNARGADIRLEREPLAVDRPARHIYAVDSQAGRLHRYDMHARAIADLGPVPGGPIPGSSGMEGAVVWDSTNRLLLFFRIDGRTMHAYDPASRTWDSPPTVTEPAALKPHVRHAFVYDPGHNVAALLGTTDVSNRKIYLYRYR